MQSIVGTWKLLNATARERDRHDAPFAVRRKKGIGRVTFTTQGPGGEVEAAADGALPRAPRRERQGEKVRFALDSPVEQRRFELVWGFSCQVVIFGLLQFFVRSGKAVLHPVAYDQVRGARGRGQGTETLAKLGGLPLSVGCVSQRLDA